MGSCKVNRQCNRRKAVSRTKGYCVSQSSQDKRYRSIRLELNLYSAAFCYSRSADPRPNRLHRRVECRPLLTDRLACRSFGISLNCHNINSNYHSIKNHNLQEDISKDVHCSLFDRLGAVAYQSGTAWATGTAFLRSSL